MPNTEFTDHTPATLRAIASKFTKIATDIERLVKTEMEEREPPILLVPVGNTTAINDAMEDGIRYLGVLELAIHDARNLRGDYGIPDTKPDTKAPKSNGKGRQKKEPADTGKDGDKS